MHPYWLAHEHVKRCSTEISTPPTIAVGFMHCYTLVLQTTREIACYCYGVVSTFESSFLVRQSLLVVVEQASRIIR